MDNSRDPLNDDLRDLLATYRAAVQPPAASELRIRESLQASVPDWSTPPRPADEGVLLSFASRRRQAVFFLCSAAAALALTIGLSSYLGEQRQRAQDDQQSLFQRRDAEPSQGQARVRDEGDAESNPGQAWVRDAEPSEAPGHARAATTSTPDERLDGAPLGEAPPSVDERPAHAAPPERSEGSTEGAASAERGSSRATPATPRRAAKADTASPSPRPEREEESAPLQAEEPSEGATGAASSLDLAEELRLIREAENHLRAGRDAQAIKVLNRHRRDFPAGQLEPEREASRITALCQQGLEHEASERAQVFAGRWPQSPLLPRVLRVCTTGTGL